MDGSRFGGVVSMLNVKAAAEMDLGRLKKWLKEHCEVQEEECEPGVM